MREHILEQVALPNPPAKWLDLGMAQIVCRGWYEWYWQRGVDPHKKRTSLSQGLRDYVMERDDMLCGLCGYFVDRPDVHIDHVVPVVHGGLDVAGNLQVSHARCNLAKGARL